MTAAAVREVWETLQEALHDDANEQTLFYYQVGEQDGNEATAAAVRQVWETLREALHDESPQVAEGAALAAAALTRAAASSSARIVADDVVAALTEATRSRYSLL